MDWHFAMMSCAAPVMQVADAHQRASFTINGKDYLFVRSLNEPIFVNNKTGVELRAIWKLY